jgi:prepilin-type N-terminal cleavage/methylation domain-containing protein
MKKPRGGFTLLEMLLALSLFALLSTGLAAALKTGLDAWHRGRGMEERQQRARAILETLALELRNALPAPGRGLTGEESSVSFLTVRRSVDEDGSPLFRVARVTYRLVDGPEGFEKELEKTEDLLDGRPARTASLSAAPSLVRFLYAYAPEKEGEGLLWQPRWDADALPAGIRVTLSLPDPSEGAYVLEKTLDLPAGSLPAWKPS